MKIWHWLWYKYHQAHLAYRDMPIKKHVYHSGKYVKHGVAIDADIHCY